MRYIYSTLSAPVNYCFYKIGADKTPRLYHKILIHGDAGVASKHCITARGRVTEITDEDFELLLTNEVFKLHVDKGYVQYEDVKRDVDTIVENMEARDRSAPRTPADYGNEDALKPTVIEAKKRR